MRGHIDKLDYECFISDPPRFMDEGTLPHQHMPYLPFLAPFMDVAYTQLESLGGVTSQCRCFLGSSAN